VRWGVTAPWGLGCGAKVELALNWLSFAVGGRVRPARQALGNVIVAPILRDVSTGKAALVREFSSQGGLVKARLQRRHACTSLGRRALGRAEALPWGRWWVAQHAAEVVWFGVFPPH
jgi:hypothetical protein